MHFHPFEVSTPHILYACLGGFVVFLYIGEACSAFFFGVIIGPYGLKIFDPRSWENSTSESITLEFTRVVIAIGVFAVGVELPKKYIYRHWKSLFFLLVPVTTWGWFVSAAFIYAFIPNLNFLSSLAIAACLTPTDPILAAAIIGGKYADKHVPAHLRHMLAAESASNDSAAYIFLFFALYLTLDRTTGGAIKDWLLILWLYQIVLSVIWGSMLGYSIRHLMKFCERKDLIDRQSYVAQYISLALLTVGTSTLLGTEDLLASFACGTAFSWDGFFNRQTEASVFSSVIDLLLNSAAFVYVGAWMPFDSFSDKTLSLSIWRLICIAILVLLLRRLPIILGLFKWIPDIKSFREALFSGHFGPIGIGAIFISSLATEILPRPQKPPSNQAEHLATLIQPVVAFMVLCSILIHGLSIPFFSLGRRVTTVTRTWSRQPSHPDWALHTRRIERPGDVVINHDLVNMMERGQAGEGAKEGLSTEPSVVVGPEEDEKKDSAVPREDSVDADAVTVVVTELEEFKADNAPDDTEVFGEWKEGPHRIIERRTGPGEEVEVEVQSNAYGPSEAERIVCAFRGGRAVVHRAASAFIGGVMRHIPHDVETGLKGMLGSRSGNSIGLFLDQHPRLQSPRSHPEGEETVMPAPEATYDVSNSCGEPESAGVRQDEEDGWVSDRSWSEDAPGYRQTAKHHHSRLNKKRHTDRHHSSIHVHHHSRLPLHHHPRLPFHHHHHSRLPLHVPMGISTSTTSAAGSPKLALDVSNSSDAEVTPSMAMADEETRGRRLPASTPSTPERLPRHMRIMSLRGSAASSREVSPVRSIRWADEGAGAGPATARWPQSPCASAQSSRAPSRAPSPGPSTPGEPIEPDLG
ncbi:Sodium/hydrogen exchanger family-domain-containing protein [Russula emetica]|nr:Sodium/hydrogen exchanger family-domain-containing protein [Russula emetica]